MKTLLLLFALTAATFLSSAQSCTPGTNFADSTFGLWPSTSTNFPPASIGCSYSTNINFKVPSTITADFVTEIPEAAPFVGSPISSYTITSVTGLPSGFLYACNISSCQYNGGSNGCSNIYGTTLALAGSYPVSIEVDLIVLISLFPGLPPFPVTLSTSFDGYSIELGPIVNTTTSVTACNSYTWNGTTYTTSGTYTGTTTNCVTQSLNLTITPAPAQPTLACYETATFNTTTCSWVISGPQAPQKMSYQAVIRNSADSLLISTPVGMRISLVQGTPSGTVVFSETQTATTNSNGLVSLQIGMGTVVTGTFACIDWASGPYYVKTETDLAGGTNYTIISSNELLSVPYALFSANGPTGAQGPAGPAGPQGPIGLTGATGPQGPIGLTGADGTPGATGITITSVSTAGDTLYLSNGQIFVAGSNTGGTGALVLPTITTNAVTGITSNSATFGGAISNANGNQIMERGIVYSTSPNPSLGSNKIIIGNAIGTFDTISALGYNYPHLLNSNTTYYARAYAVTENNISVYGNEVSFTTLSVGQSGPGGGIVFFNKGNSTSSWQYLETATSDQSTGLAWGCTGLSIPGTQLAVGSGEANTSLIVAGCNEASFPAKICDNLLLGGQTDWFLPSRDELTLMYKNLHTNNQGNFSSSYYWSSTEDGASHAGSLSLTSGSAGNGSMPKHLTLYVRAVRAF